MYSNNKIKSTFQKLFFVPFARKNKLTGNRIAELEERLTDLEDDSDVNVFDLRSEFPEAGELNKLYIAADEGKTYVWVNNDYLPVGGTASSYEEPTIIHGGSATSTN